MHALHDLLDARRHDLLRRWDARVRAARGATALALPTLLATMPDFLDELTAALRRSAGTRPSAPPPALQSLATAHGAQRLGLGFDVTAVVAEYNLMRAVIYDVVEMSGIPVAVRELAVLSDYISLASADAVAAYQRQRDAAQARQAAAHLGFLAHELRNPLAVARTAFDLLRRTVLAAGGKPVELLDQGLRRVGDLIDQALVAEHLRAGVEPHREPLALDTLLTSAADESSLDADAKGLRLTVDVPLGVTFSADPRLVRSVVTNLVRNAVKFSRAGGTLHVRGRIEGSDVVIEVEDACGGLPPGVAARLFDPFVQAGADRTGFGLGLAIAKQAAEAHQGTLQVEDRPGQGCVFVLCLPAAVLPPETPS